MNSALWKTILLLGGSVCGALLPSFVSAQTAKTPVIGSPDTATADPPVSRPQTQPIQVPLFHDLAFTNFTAKTFRYHPPAGPRRRWAKVILTADFSVTPGRQYDRTAQIMIGRANVYFGTTMEPSRTVGPAWHVERDVTDDLALLQSAQPGEAILGNIVNATYTGVIHGSASLLFYPAERKSPAAETPDVVLPLPSKAGGAANVSGPGGALTETFAFPTNVVRAYLD
ncbi:MAG: peptide-N(4)-(N-acetyl-beta-glucosaminyl)asparagine amidase, partial [Armatimonadota bacterium]|nr:peptide-N(4)-(N-acetyl-beta-glucosaminyl)asparagine amidase [Armatimonadota bacterium]